MEPIARFLVANPNLAVAVMLGCVAATAALLGLVFTLWVKPKIADVDDLRSRVTKIETKFELLPDFQGLQILVSKLEGARQGETVARDVIIEDTIKRLEGLHLRSKAELERMVEAKEITWAIEQAGQDVDLAQSVEFFSRLAGGDRHKAAQDRLAKAQAKLEELESMRRRPPGQ